MMDLMCVVGSGKIDFVKLSSIRNMQKHLCSWVCLSNQSAHTPLGLSADVQTGANGMPWIPAPHR